MKRQNHLAIPTGWTAESWLRGLIEHADKEMQRVVAERDIYKVALEEIAAFFPESKHGTTMNTFHINQYCAIAKQALSGTPIKTMEPSPLTEEELKR